MDSSNPLYLLVVPFPPRPFYLIKSRRHSLNESTGIRTRIFGTLPRNLNHWNHTLVYIGRAARQRTHNHKTMFFSLVLLPIELPIHISAGRDSNPLNDHQCGICLLFPEPTWRYLNASLTHMRPESCPEHSRCVLYTKG